MHSVGFEPTSVATVELESTALDRSATNASKINYFLYKLINGFQIHREIYKKKCQRISKNLKQLLLAENFQLQRQ